MGKRFTRKTATKDYRKLYVVAMEGDKTEPLYFSMFKSRGMTVQLELIRSKNKSAPINVFQNARNAVKRTGLRKGDEVWLIIDDDSRSHAEIQKAFSACSKAGYTMALTYPKFEYWLLLHFEDGNGGPSPAEIDRKLKTYLPNFTKGNIELEKLRPLIADAVRRAKSKSRSGGQWPKQHGSDVYQLIEKLMS